MTYLEDLMRIEDMRFIDAVDEAVEHARVMAERRRWRDGKRVVHELRPVESVRLTDGARSIGGWVATCGKRYQGTVQHDPESPITCVTCLARSLAEPQP